LAEQTATDVPDGERKTVTALFADIKGSMELMEDLDPEEARAIVDPALKLMIDAVRRYDGYIVQSTGDGIFAVFGAPIAHEDHPQRALYAALRMQDEMQLYGDRMRTHGQTPLQVRIGVNTGEVVVRSIQTGTDHTEYTPIGHSTGLAARLQTLATPGTTMISEATRRLVEGFFQLKGRGPSRLKGVSEQVDVYEVTGLGPLRTRFQRAASYGLTKFVGRQHEMEALAHAGERAQSGYGQIVAVMADPGVGKSRLFYEFKAKSQSGWMMLGALSISHGKASAYLPVIELLCSFFEISVVDDARKRREKVAGKIAILDRSLEDTLPYLFSLLRIVEGDDPLAQMDAQLKKRRTLEAIKRTLLRESLSQPLMVIFEDLHWIDEQTQELLNLLADSIGTAKVLLLVNYRPEYRHDWNRKTYYRQLRLDPLHKEGAEEMSRVLLGEEAALAPVRRLVMERTEGNPFFMEEMVQALFEEGVLARNGSIRLIKPLSGVRVPTTVKGVLSSRVDRLLPGQKELLQTLSIIGREFPISLVRHVAERRNDELDQMLALLQNAEFIYEQPTTGGVGYIFKHALTQEVAYGSVLIERRRATHERVAAAIEALYCDRIEEHLSDLAHHYRRTDNKEKAVDYLKRAAAQAADHSAVSEAESQLRDAVSLLAAGEAGLERDRVELELQSALGVLLGSRSFGAAEREHALRRAYELSERLGKERETLALLYQLGQFYVEQARFRELQEISTRAVTLADQVQDQVLRAGAQEILGECRLWTGDLLPAQAFFRRALKLCEEISPAALIRAFGFDLAIIAGVFLGIAELLLGWPEQAMQSIQPAIERARSSSHPFSYTLGLITASFQWWLRGDANGASEILIPARRICDEYEFHELTGMAKQIHGWSHFWQGPRAVGLAEMSEAIRELNAVGAFIFSPCRFVLLAEMELEDGNDQAAETLVKEAMAKLKFTEEGWYEPEVHRIAAKVMLKKPDSDPAGAETYLYRAIEVAKIQGAKWWELRATTSIARLLASQRRRDEARAMLAEIYNWFTEGFDTADLKDAKALLDELGN
jgi:predicted ATPase/class 3 adenylate cyclase